MDRASPYYSKKNRNITATTVLPIGILRDIIMAVIVVWLTSPYQAFFSNWYIYGALWIIWIALAFASDSTSFIQMLKSKYTIAAFSWPCSIGILSLLGWAEFALYQFTIVFVISAFVYYAMGRHFRGLKFLVAVYIIYAILICLYSIQALQTNPEVSRILAQSNKTVTSNFANPFMANFSFVNSATLVALFLAYYAKITRKKVLKLLGIAMLILEVCLLLCAQYSIALFLFVAFFAIVMLFYGIDARSGKKTIALILLCIFCLVLIPFVGNILISIADSIPMGYVERRVRSIGEMLNNGSVSSGSDLAERLNLYMLSISTFFQHFFFGVGGAEYGANGLVGAHSQILDNFAYYGVFFGTQFVWYLICVYKNGARLFDGGFKKIYKLIFLVYMIQCILNTSYNEEMLFVMFFIIPSMIYLAQHRHNITGEKY